MPDLTLRIHTGPSIVRSMANAISEAGVSVAAVGTEAVYIHRGPGSAARARAALHDALHATHGTAFGLAGLHAPANTYVRAEPKYE